MYLVFEERKEIGGSKCSYSSAYSKTQDSILKYSTIFVSETQ